MFAELKHTLRRLRGAMIGWGIGLFLYDLLMSSFYSSIMDIGYDLTQMLDSYPQEMLAFFPSISEFTSPAGYLDTYFFSYMTLIVGIFAIGACANLIAGDEEKGILDLVLAHPINRAALYWGRLLGFFAATGIILLAGWVGWLIPAKNAGLNLTWLEFARPFLPLFAVLVLFGTLALLLSMLLPAARLAGGLAGALLVGNFLLVGLSSLNPDLEPLYKLTPFYFHQGGSAINGLDWGNLAGLLAVTLILALLAWWRFQQRDIRVGGEGSWGLPALIKLLRRETAPG